MSELSTMIRKLVDDPTVSEVYGAWGILQPIQRKQIRELCDLCDAFETSFEVEHIRAEEATRKGLPTHCQACSEEEAIKVGKAYGRREAAEEIFAAIEGFIYRHCNETNYSTGDMAYDIAALKERFIEGGKL